MQKRHWYECDDQDGKEKPEAAHAACKVGHCAKDEPGSPRACDKDERDAAQQQIAFAKLRGCTDADAKDDAVGYADNLKKQGEARLLFRFFQWNKRWHDDVCIMLEHLQNAKARKWTQAEHADIERERKQIHDQVRGCAECHRSYEHRCAGLAVERGDELNPDHEQAG